jgi:hypothetical protein
MEAFEKVETLDQEELAHKVEKIESMETSEKWEDGLRDGSEPDDKRTT